ncbi:PREDICTED: odorant receptor 9a-like [Eufriesea mexicana]|uniref:odorant receptor 9a-like n=1 Tax=Eufriesea mexicana TaxID=516756 RepID=UPI00083C0257|nr:PREDICTED: odorant receptor 9a-like [Eufriesea mexicana]
MDLIGIWPEPDRTDQRWLDFKAVTCLAVIAMFGTGPQSSNLLFIWGDLELVTENLSMANIPGINAMIKLIPIIQSFYDDWQCPRTEEEKTTMLKMAKPARFISIWCSVLTRSMVTVYLGSPAFTIYQSDKVKERQDHLVLYPGYFPYDIRPTPVLILTNFGQVITAYSATISYTAVDTFIAVLVMHMCGQFEILRMKLQRLMGDEEGSKNQDEFRKNLAWIVNRHEHLNQFATKIEDCFNTLLLIQILLCTVEICFQDFLFFNVLLQNEDGIFNTQFLFFILFVCFILVHMYLYCYIGEMLLVQSREMSNSAYESNWFNVSPPEAKCLLFIMRRSTRPLCLTAGKFGTFSMEMFSSVCTDCMSHFST